VAHVNEVTLEGLDDEARQVVADRISADAAALERELQAVPTK
jgi:hypothetical protein